MHLAFAAMMAMPEAQAPNDIDALSQASTLPLGGTDGPEHSITHPCTPPRKRKASDDADVASFPANNKGPAEFSQATDDAVDEMLARIAEVDGLDCTSLIKSPVIQKRARDALLSASQQHQRHQEEEHVEDKDSQPLLEDPAQESDQEQVKDEFEFSFQDVMRADIEQQQQGERIFVPTTYLNRVRIMNPFMI